MVRLSLIVLCLLAAAWCSNGADKGFRIMQHKGHVHFACATFYVIEIKSCHKVPTRCSLPSYDTKTVKCVSEGTLAYIKKRCEGHASCGIIESLKKGKFMCNYRCIKKVYNR